MGEYEVSDINTKTNLMKSGKYKDIAECGVCINSCSVHMYVYMYIVNFHSKLQRSQKLRPTSSIIKLVRSFCTLM